MANSEPASFQSEMNALAVFLDILEQVGIAYAIGGSVASSIYGKVRFTEDADVAVEPFSLTVSKQLIQLLSGDFYVSQPAIEQALSMRSSFNAIHIATAFKIDVFITNETAFQKRLLLRRKYVPMPSVSDKMVWAVCPEDIILLKLDWYRQGGFVSEKQWNDILGLLSVQKNQLDMADLKKWANELNLMDIFKQAVNAAEPD